MSEEDLKPTRREKVKQHLRENKKEYLIGGGCLVIGVSIGSALVFHHMGGVPLEIRQSAKNTALIVWKSPPTNIALIKRACPDPIPVLDKTTGEAYGSINRAAAMTKTAYAAIRNDAHSAQERWQRLSDSVFA